MNRFQFSTISSYDAGDASQPGRRAIGKGVVGQPEQTMVGGKCDLGQVPQGVRALSTGAWTPLLPSQTSVFEMPSLWRYKTRF
jgi:hypothetical protein